MPSPPAPQFVVRRRDGESGCTLVLSGELDMYSAPVLERALDNVAQYRPARTVLDLGGLSFMDVSGLRAILDAARSARRDGRALEIANPLPHIIRLLELTAIDQSLEVRGRPLAAVV